MLQYLIITNKHPEEESHEQKRPNFCLPRKKDALDSLESCTFEKGEITMRLLITNKQPDENSHVRRGPKFCLPRQKHAKSHVLFQIMHDEINDLQSMQC